MSNHSIVFLIQRLAEFRYMGSVIEAALEMGHRVELWHDYSKPRGGRKDYQYPLIESTPVFRGGVEASRTYESRERLAEMLRQRLPDCVVASRGYTDYLHKEDGASLNLPWVAIQEHFDYAMFGLDAVTSATLQCIYTPHWMGKVAELYLKPSEHADFNANMERICRVTGSTQADGVALVDPDETRSHWNIPANRKVVVYLPSMSGVGLYEKVFLENNKLVQAARILKAKRWLNLQYVLKPFSDKALVKSVRRFCDRNNAFLLVKTRKKQPLPDYLERTADLVVFDETEYPATILNALSVASFCVSAYPSTSINDSAASGVPFLSVYRDMRHWTYGHHRFEYAKHPAEVFFDAERGDYFNYPGVGYVMGDVEAIKRLPELSLSDFPLREEARRAFLDEYVGALDGRNGHRVIEQVESLLKNSLDSYKPAQGVELRQ